MLHNQHSRNVQQSSCNKFKCPKAAAAAVVVNFVVVAGIVFGYLLSLLMLHCCCCKLNAQITCEFCTCFDCLNPLYPRLLLSLIAARKTMQNYAQLLLLLLLLFSVSQQKTKTNKEIKVFSPQNKKKLGEWSSLCCCCCCCSSDNSSRE